MIFEKKGKPMVFYMEMCQEREDVRDKIVRNGGAFSVERNNDTIHLIPYNKDYVLPQRVNHRVYSYKFVVDSVATGKLKPLEGYRLRTSENILRNKSRLKYSRHEEIAMFDYINSHPGNPICKKYWEDAKREIVINHTAESIRAHWKLLRYLKDSPVKENTESRKIKIPTSNIENNESIVRNEESKYEEFSSREGSDDRIENSDYDLTDDESCNISLAGDGKKSYSVEKRDMKYDGISIIKKKKTENFLDESSVQQYFDVLVDLCSHASGMKLSESDVLKSLISHNGVVADTIKSFKP